MAKVRLKVLGLSYSQTQSGAYALVLSEENGNRRIPIIIGGFEAQAIAIELEGLKPPRPLTHDLLVNFCDAFAISIVEVNIHHLEDGIFYSELVCDNNGSCVKIDARTSDAVALAIRCNCPIYTTETIMARAGVVFNAEDAGEDKKERESAGAKHATSPDNKYNNLKLNELKELLDKSISNEDYEEASHLRDEIQRREEAGEE